MQRLLRNGLATLAMLTILSEACASTPRSVAPAPSAPIASPAPPPPAPVRSCLAWDEVDCDKKCDRGSALDCLRLWVFYAAYARGLTDPGFEHDDAEAPELAVKRADAWRRAQAITVRACDAGDFAMCRAIFDWKQIDHGMTDYGSPSFPVPDEVRSHVIDRASAGCDAGDTTACEVLLVAVENPHPDASFVARAEALAARYRAACEAGTAEACAKAARLLDREDWYWHDKFHLNAAWKRAPSVAREAGELWQRGCAAGDADSCAGLERCHGRSCQVDEKKAETRRSIGGEDTPKSALSLYERQCREGKDAACVAVSRYLSVGGYGTMGGSGFVECDREAPSLCEHEFTSVILSRQCHAGNKAACEALRDLLEDARRLYEALHLGCERGSIDACDKLVGAFVFADGTSEKDADTSGLSAEEVEALHRDALMVCKAGRYRRCDDISPWWFKDGTKERAEVETIAKASCQRYDHPKPHCTEYMGALCLAYCNDAGMRLPK